MTALTWDEVGSRKYETGVDHGVLYRINESSGEYDTGFAWNGLTTVTESPSGAESNKTYADNILYLNLISLELFGATIEAYTYPEQFAECDGSAQPEPGVSIGQQPRKPFGLCYRTLVGNDVSGTELGYKLHLVYNCLAAPSEKAYASINDQPEGINFSWEVSTTPVPVTDHKPTATLVIDSTLVDADALTALSDILYGTVGSDPRLPMPDEVLALFAGTITSVFPTLPTYVNATHTLTIPATTGVIYSINGVDQVAGDQTVTGDLIVHMRPAAGYVFTQPSVDDFFVDFS